MQQLPDLSGFTGTEQYWRWYPGSDISLTDGVENSAITVRCKEVN